MDGLPVLPVGVVIAGGFEVLQLVDEVVLAELEPSEFLGELLTSVSRAVVALVLGGTLKLGAKVPLTVRAEDPLGEEVPNRVQEDLFAYPQALGVFAVPVGASLVMLPLRLAREIGDGAPRLTEHAPLAEVTGDVGAQPVRALRLRMAVDSAARAGALPVFGHRRGGFEQLLGDQGLVGGVR
ncbi:hypothetical protein [Actinoallomurus acaciae]|uniref:Uncharacterized protein n=1 Tax=Actinoallomurus acaciae TaxID=502577 RepID=A0ABV5YAK1_9ACTN